MESSLATQGTDQVQSSAVGKPNVGNYHRGLELLRQALAVGDAVGLSDDGEVLVSLESPGKPLSNEVVIVHEKYGVGHVASIAVASAGSSVRWPTVTVTSVPEPVLAFWAMSRVALMRAARSCMIRRP